MSRKHNVRKRGQRSRSRYPERLAARGLKTTPQMESLETLTGWQRRRANETGVPWFRAGSVEDRRETGEVNT